MDKVNEIKIVVAGTTGSGKSTVVEMIKKMLDSYGFNDVIIKDEDLYVAERITNQAERVAHVASNTKVTIEGTQLPRSGKMSSM